MKTMVLFLAAALLGCSTPGKHAGGSFAGEGEAVYRANCAQCHRLYPPASYTYEKLERYVRKYGRGLEPGERQKLREYLKEASGK